MCFAQLFVDALPCHEFMLMHDVVKAGRSERGTTCWIPRIGINPFRVPSMKEKEENRKERKGRTERKEKEKEEKRKAKRRKPWLGGSLCN